MNFVVYTTPSAFLYQKDERAVPENIHKSLFIVCFFSSVLKYSINLILLLFIARNPDVLLVINQQ